MSEKLPGGLHSLRRAWHGEDAYGWVFLLLIFAITMLITLPFSTWTVVVQVALVAATLVLALRTSSAGPRLLKYGQIAAGVALVASVGIATSRINNGAGILYIIIAGLLLVTPPVMLRHIMTRPTVTGRVLLGALSVYLMIGLFFSFLFLGMAQLNDGVFFNQLDTTAPTDFVYFSYVTMLTIGYGDLTPITEAGRLLSILDGLLGQIFLVTMIARLVSLYGGMPHRGNDGSDSEN